MGAVSQLHPPSVPVAGVWGWGEKEKWEREGWIYLRRRKGNFTLVSLHDQCPPAKPVICPSRVVPLFSEAAVSDHHLSFSAFPHMVPHVVHMRKPWTDTVDFVESRQACDEAASRYQQDPDRLIGASDTDPGKETKKMAAACSVCLHDAVSDVNTADGKGILNKTCFFFSSVRENQTGACVVSPSLCVDLLHSCLSLLPLVLLLLLCPSVFNKDPSDLVKQKLLWSCLTSPSWCQWTQMVGWPLWG